MLAIGDRWRPRVRLETVVLGVVAYLVLTANGPWWSALLAGRSLSEASTWLFVAACFSALVALHFVALAMIGSRWIIKPVLTIVLVASAAASYYMRTYAVMLDPTMLQNVLQTDLREARELLSWSLVFNTAAWSFVPVAAIWLVRIEDLAWWRAIGFRVACIAAALLIAVLSVLAVARDLTSTMRNNREQRYLITPGNYIYGLAANVAKNLQAASGPRQPLGLDARLAASMATRPRPRVLVLVVGETARAANFSLMGYARDTNPKLARLDVISYQNVTACGTSTEVSVPCMFSRQGRADYDERAIRQSEGLLNVLARAGYDVKWRDNQSGCKGVCVGAGIEYLKLDRKFAPDLCDSDECFDEILIRSLTADLATVRSNTVIVLHMMGNHGPAYYRRYPDAFRQFRPDCQTAELRECERAEVVNSYDNAILYTDHVIAGLVETLRARADKVDGALLYVSDHGESLGEGGLYLHGLPYSIAPDVQTRVPMIAWVSVELAATERLDWRCLRGSGSQPLSHDNLFDTMLGLASIESSIYRPQQDVFRFCRAG